MKRVVLVFLSFLLLLPLLMIPVSATEVFVFERVPTNIMFLGSDLDFFYQDGFFVYPGQVPSGKYSVSFDGEDEAFLVDSIDVSFSEMVQLGDSFYPGCTSECIFSGDGSLTVIFVCCYVAELDSTGFALISPDTGYVMDFSDYSSATFTSVHSSFGSDFFSNCINVVSSGLSTVSNICSVIANDGFLLLCAGFLFLGGLVGLSGRLMSRD